MKNRVVHPLAAVLSLLVLLGAGLVGIAPARAEVLGPAQLTPATGNAESLINITTSGPCRAPATALSATIIGPGFTGAPGTGTAANIIPTTTANFSTTDPITTPFQTTVYTLAAQKGVSTLSGDYTISFNCTNTFGTTIVDTYITVMTFTMGTGGSADENLRNATYTTPSQTETTTTALTASPATTAVAGTPVTLTANVTPSAAAGSVQFKDGANNLGTAVPVAAGSATTSVTSLSVGAHTLTAVFTPTDSNAYTTSTSAAVAYTITAPPATATTTALSATPASPQIVGASVTLNAAVTPGSASAADIDTGLVAFFNGATSLGTDSSIVDGAASISTTALPIGTNSLTAVFTPADAAMYAGSTSPAISYTINPQPSATTQTSLTTSAASPVEAGTTVSFTATVVPAAAAGSVQFKDGDANLGDPVAVTGGTATYETADLTVGTHSVTAVFLPANASEFGSSTSAAVSVVIEAVTLDIELTVEPAGPIEYGESVTLTASTGIVDLQGTIQFRDGTAPIGPAQQLVGGAASAQTSFLPVGARSLTAEFTPTPPSDYLPSTSDPVTIEVTAAESTTTLAVSPTSPAAFGAPVTLTATVTPTAATGTVQFFDGGAALGTPVDVVSGQASLTRSDLAVGTREFTATFTSSNANTSGSTSAPVSYTIDPVQTTTTLAVTPPGSAALGETVTLSATVAPGGVGTVEFLDGATALGADIVEGGVATLEVDDLELGAHSFTAAFTPTAGSGYLASTSPTVAYEIAATQTSTTLAVAPSGSAEVGDDVALTASVTPTSAAGSVEFKDGDTSLGTGAVTSGSATLTTDALAVGAHSFTAVFTPTDTAAYGGSTSAAVAYEITAVPTETTLTADPASPQTVGADVSLTVSIDPAVAGKVTIQIQEGGEAIDEPFDVVAGHHLIATLGVLDAGTYAFTAVFDPESDDYEGSTSAELAYVVNPTQSTPTATGPNGQPLPANPSLTPGTQITVVADGFEAGEEVSATVNSTPITLAPATADASGVVTYQLTIPQGLEAGPHTFVLAGANNVATLSFTVPASASTGGGGTTGGTTGGTSGGTGGSTGSSSGGSSSSSGGSLSSTGQELISLTMIGGALVLAGAGVVLASRRRRSPSSTVTFH